MVIILKSVAILQKSGKTYKEVFVKMECVMLIF